MMSSRWQCQYIMPCYTDWILIYYKLLFTSIVSSVYSLISILFVEQACNSHYVQQLWTTDSVTIRIKFFVHWIETLKLNTAWAHPFSVKLTHLRKVNPSGAKHNTVPLQHAGFARNIAHTESMSSFWWQKPYMPNAKHNGHTTKHGR